jgi:uncharacterized membrane protein YbaN (DUF454 family)
VVKFILRIIGFFLLAFGIIGVLSPIPFGLFFILLSMLFLVPTTPSFTRLVQRFRKKFPSVDKRMTSMTGKVPYPYRRVLRETEVERDF